MGKVVCHHRFLLQWITFDLKNQQLTSWQCKSENWLLAFNKVLKTWHFWLKNLCLLLYVPRGFNLPNLFCFTSNLLIEICVWLARKNINVFCLAYECQEINLKMKIIKFLMTLHSCKLELVSLVILKHLTQSKSKMQ